MLTLGPPGRERIDEKIMPAFESSGARSDAKSDSSFADHCDPRNNGVGDGGTIEGFVD
jgi:hypothetical protein